MTKKLFIEAMTKFILGVVLVGLLIFLPAGTVSFFNGWLLMGILFVPMFLAGIVMMLKNPNLLKSRLNAKEKQQEQSLVVKLSGLMAHVAEISYYRCSGGISDCLSSLRRGIAGKYISQPYNRGAGKSESH